MVQVSTQQLTGIKTSESILDKQGGDRVMVNVILTNVFGPIYI